MAGYSPHPGAVLWAEFLEPYRLTQQAAADALGINRVNLNRVLMGHAAVSPLMALRLERLFGFTAEFWMNLQMAYDLDRARKKLGAALDRIVPLNPPGVMLCQACLTGYAERLLAQPVKTTYGDPPVEIAFEAPVWHCFTCDEMYTAVGYEEAERAAIQAHKAKSPPPK